MMLYKHKRTPKNRQSFPRLAGGAKAPRPAGRPAPETLARSVQRRFSFCCPANSLSFTPAMWRLGDLPLEATRDLRVRAASYLAWGSLRLTRGSKYLRLPVYVICCSARKVVVLVRGGCSFVCSFDTSRCRYCGHSWLFWGGCCQVFDTSMWVGLNLAASYQCNRAA